MLRWAPMWTQWIFDDDHEDITSVAWRPHPLLSTEPDLGNQMWRQGSTCCRTCNGRPVTLILDVSEEWTQPAAEAPAQWPAAAEVFRHGGGMWGVFPEISASAQWIWSEDLSDQEVHCVYRRQGDAGATKGKLTVHLLEYGYNCRGQCARASGVRSVARAPAAAEFPSTKPARPKASPRAPLARPTLRGLMLTARPPWRGQAGPWATRGTIG